MKQYVFDLYVAGPTARSKQAARNMEELCERYFPGDYLLNVIDVLDDPQLAEQEKIIATPTLVQRAPSSGRRIIGALSDRKATLEALGLDPQGNGIEE
ncbi:MAG: circadian clock KaiB family protein [Thermodesulfobacteriota bacterium]